MGAVCDSEVVVELGGEGGVRRGGGRGRGWGSVVHNLVCPYPRFHARQLVVPNLVEELGAFVGRRGRGEERPPIPHKVQQRLKVLGVSVDEYDPLAVSATWEGASSHHGESAAGLLGQCVLESGEEGAADAKRDCGVHHACRCHF